MCVYIYIYNYIYIILIKTKVLQLQRGYLLGSTSKASNQPYDIMVEQPVEQILNTLTWQWNKNWFDLICPDFFPFVNCTICVHLPELCRARMVFPQTQLTSAKRRWLHGPLLQTRMRIEVTLMARYMILTRSCWPQKGGVINADRLWHHIQNRSKKQQWWTMPAQWMLWRYTQPIRWGVRIACAPYWTIS